MQNNRNENNVRENHSSQNARDVLVDIASQESPENKKDSYIEDLSSSSFNTTNRNNEQNQKADYKATDNLMPNPDDFDEGDDEDSQGKGRTPGL